MTANSFAQQHHITKVLVNEFKLRTNITFSKDYSGRYILDQLSPEAGNCDIFVVIKVRKCEI